jgi:hypothetical protein
MSSGYTCVTFFEHRKSPTLCLPRYAYHAMLTMLSVINKMRRVLEMTLIRTINLQPIQLASDGDVCMAAVFSTLSFFDYLFVACLMLGKTAEFNTNSLVGLCKLKMDLPVSRFSCIIYFFVEFCQASRKRIRI